MNERSFRGYDTPDLFREDTIRRVRQLYSEIAELKKEMNRVKRLLPNYKDEDPD